MGRGGALLAIEAVERIGQIVRILEREADLDEAVDLDRAAGLPVDDGPAALALADFVAWNHRHLCASPRCPRCRYPRPDRRDPIRARRRLQRCLKRSYGGPTAGAQDWRPDGISARIPHRSVTVA